MKKSSVSLIVTVSAFLIGVLLTWMCFYFISPRPVATEIVSQVEKKSGDLEVNFKRIYKDETVYVAEFEVVNNSPQDFYFMGYGKDQICGFNFKNVESLVSFAQLIQFDYSSCSCGTGLKKTSSIRESRQSLRLQFRIKEKKFLKSVLNFIQKVVANLQFGAETFRKKKILNNL